MVVSELLLLGDKVPNDPQKTPSCVNIQMCVKGEQF